MIDFVLFLRTIENNMSYMCYLRNKISILVLFKKSETRGKKY